MPRNNEVKFVRFDKAGYWKYFNLPNPSLKSYFGLVRDGQSEVFTGTFAGLSKVQSFPLIAKQVSKIQNEWDRELVSIKDTWPTLYEFEEDLRAKVGPMSHRFAYRYQVDNILAYYEGILLPSKPVSNSAIAAVIAEWSKVRGLHIRGQERTIDLMRKSTSSGSPYFVKRRLVVDKTSPVKIFHNSETHMMQHGTDWLATAILGWRGQEGGPKYDDTKQRVVWMFPFGVNVCELQVYQPLIEAAQKFNLVPAWVSMEAVDAAITRLFDTKSSKDLIVCTDFTAFDQHINADLQDCAKSILNAILNHDAESLRWINQVFPVKYDIPLTTAEGVFWKGNHGMASGSGGTNADETLLHRALQYEAAQSVGAKLNPNSQCLGDDGILSYPGITVEDVTRAYKSHGLDMNESKQYASAQDCTYLRRWHHTDYRINDICVGVYSTHRALGRLMYQERYYDPDEWGPKMVALRQLSIIENVKNHPLCEQFANFCMKRDKYRLGLDIPGFLDNIESEAKKAIDHMPDFLGYTKSMQKDADKGISEWWIVKYLKSIK